MDQPPFPSTYETLERPSLVITYHMGDLPVQKGSMVGLDDEGLLVPIERAVCFVGMAHENHAGVSRAKAVSCVNVSCTGSFVLGFVGWRPTLVDLQRAVWVYDGTTVSGAPLRTGIPAGRVVAIDITSDGRPGVRVKIDQAASKVLPPLPGKVEEAQAWYRARSR